MNALPPDPADHGASGDDAGEAIGSAHLVHRDYQRIAAAIRYLDEHWAERPGLARLAAAAQLSPWHFNRLFRRWAGVTPKQYLQWLALDAAKLALAAPGGSVLAAAYAAGCSGPGRLHDLFVSIEAMTPGEYRDGGAGVTVRYGVAPTPFGPMLAARTERGVCHLSFPEADGGDDNDTGDGDGIGTATGIDGALAALAAEWPHAALVRDDAAAADLAATLWPATPAGRRELTVAVRGTNFQIRVWRALLQASEHGATTYGALARALGNPGASRAIGGAVGDNPVGWIIPCHRVLRAGGQLGGYRWQPSRKRTMLAWEYAQERARAARSGG